MLQCLGFSRYLVRQRPRGGLLGTGCGRFFLLSGPVVRGCSPSRFGSGEGASDAASSSGCAATAPAVSTGGVPEPPSAAAADPPETSPASAWLIQGWNKTPWASQTPTARATAAPTTAAQGRRSRCGDRRRVGSNFARRRRPAGDGDRRGRVGPRICRKVQERHQVVLEFRPASLNQPRHVEQGRLASPRQKHGNRHPGRPGKSGHQIDRRTRRTRVHPDRVDGENQGEGGEGGSRRPDGRPDGGAAAKHALDRHQHVAEETARRGSLAARHGRTFQVGDAPRAPGAGGPPFLYRHSRCGNFDERLDAKPRGRFPPFGRGRDRLFG